MHLLSVDKSESPLLPGFLRVAGNIRFDSGDAQTIWFDVPAEQAPAIIDQGDAWAALLLSDAAVRGEELRIDLPVDPTLLDNLRGLNRLWQDWFNYVHPVDIQAPAGRSPVAGTETGLFFSGGIDSFFSLISGRSQADHPGVPPTSSLLTIWGFDIPLSNPEEFAAVRALAEDTARQFGMDCIPIATNMSILSSSKLHLGPLTHGAGIAAAGLLFSSRFQNLIIASSLDLGHLIPWGSHILVDPLFSTSQTRIIHDGAAFTRVEKTRLVGSAPEALSRLRVCWALGGATNCSRCSKCIRTMATLDLWGLRDQATSFDWTDYSLKAVARTYIPSAEYAEYIRAVRDFARERGRDDYARALAWSLRRSILLRYSVIGVSKWVWTMLKKVSFLKRMAMPLYGVLTRNLLGRQDPK